MPNEPIAIDGPAASGKTTVAKLVAKRLGARFVSTGELYRAVTFAALQAGIDPAEGTDAIVGMLPRLDLGFALNADGEIEVQLDGRALPSPELRGPHVAEKVGYVARVPEIREWLVERQRETRNLGWIVAEGRDIGTVVFPDTPFKFFITASPRERARRRLAQEGETAPGATLESVAQDIARRDELDSKRAVAPLKPADDAQTLFTDDEPAEAVADAIVRQVCSTG